MTKLIATAVVALSAMAGGAALWYGPPQPHAAQPDVRPVSRRAPQAAAVKAKPAPAQPAPPQDDLKLIAEHNIFLAAQGHGAASSKPPTTAPSNPTFVLKGVSQRGRQFVAFVEQPNGGGVLEVGINHALGRGRVRGISLRALDFEVDGKLNRVEVGQALGGAPDGAPAPADTAAPATRPAPAQVARRTGR